jgi:phosphoglycolate phosphatase
MNHKLIVFDWNGTLLSDTVQSWKAGNLCLEFYGRPAISLSQYRETFHFPVIHFYKLNGCDIDDVLARQSEANGLFQTAYEKSVQNARTRRGARELLQWLKLNEYHCTILSNYRTEKIEAQLNRLGLRDFFVHVCANGDDGSSILHSTSKAERLSAFMAKRGYRPQDTVIIGDSDEEPAVARQLGLTSIGITDGYISEKRLRAAKPDHVVHHLKEVVPLLSSLRV